MARGQLFALANAISPERDAEFNKWYNEVHVKELCALPGFESVTRYKINMQALPQAEKPRFQYFAVYELSDQQQALESMGKHAKNLTQTDASGPGGIAAVGHVVFEFAK